MSLLSSDIAVVLLNYNGSVDTMACLHALYGLSLPPGLIVLVDNASEAGDRERIETAWERLRSSCHGDTIRTQWVLLPQNEGFSAGNNAGIRKALQESSCRAVWILNNDTEPEPDALRALCDRLNSSPNAGMAGSTLVYAHDHDTVQCAGGFGFSKYTGATLALCGNKRLPDVLGLDPADVERSLAYLCGASMLVRREVFERMGLLAEEFFLYYEDTEFGMRARKAGYALAWAPGSIVFHKEGGTTGAKSQNAENPVQRSALMDYLSLRNRMYLVRKAYPVFLPFAVLSYAGVAMSRLRRGQIRRIPLVFRALRDGLRRRMGKPAFFSVAEKRS